MGKVINPNLRQLVADRNNGKRGTILEGSSRSAKTWSSVDFIVLLCSRYETNATINIIKETYKSFKTTLHDDFNRRLPDYGIVSPFADKSEVPSFRMFGNKINLLGADSESIVHGVSSDYTYYNEALEIPRGIFDQTEMRCRKFWWMDYNPKYTEHWIYSGVANRPDVGFLKTTFKDNPWLSEPERNKILSYQTVLQSIICQFKLNTLLTEAKDDDKKTRKQLEQEAVAYANSYNLRTNPDNYPIVDIEELQRCLNNERWGTANSYMWSVYGRGDRALAEGLIFPNVEWIDSFPTNIERHFWGADFGQTEHPAALIHGGVWKNNMYLEKLHYGPLMNADAWDEILQRAGIKKEYIWADSAEPGLISDLRTGNNKGKHKYNIFGANKFKGSVMYGIGLLNRYKMHIVDCPEWRKEQAMYRWAEVNGIRLEEPDDSFNHLWDATRYPALSLLRKN